MSAMERARIMFRYADLLEANMEELAALEALDNGKPWHVAKAADMTLLHRNIRYHAGWADKIHGQVIPTPGPFFQYTREEAVGVCAQIIPWNFPALMMAWKIGPALAAGCTTIVKPAEQTPLSALRMAELSVEAGFPDGVINVLPGFADVGQALSRHARVDKVAFTGSTAVGYDIMRNSHVHNLKRITLELGGKSANIIMDDADLDAAIEQAHTGLFFNAGACCIAGSRLFVHEKIHDEFVEKSIAKAKNMKLGNQFDLTTDQGPQVDKDQMDNILRYVETGKAEGAELHMGGARHGDKGYFVEPTVFSGVTDDMTIAKEEIFGPVMSIMKFSDVDEVIERANNSSYGLGAGLMTKSLDTAMHVSNALRVGTVYVNTFDVFSETTTFGGFKDSGIGRELADSGIKNYQETKNVIIKMNDKTLP